MKHKYNWLVIFTLLLYPVYKGAREIFWVRHATHMIDNAMQIKLRFDDQAVCFQDCETDKTIIITNGHARLRLSFVSIEPSVYFFLDTVNGVKVMSILDKFAGRNRYNYNTLQLIDKQDCFSGFGGCPGFSDSDITVLAKPYLIFDSAGFHK